jgi:hypothetical protein
MAGGRRGPRSRPTASTGSCAKCGRAERQLQGLGAGRRGAGRRPRPFAFGAEPVRSFRAEAVVNSGRARAGPRPGNARWVSTRSLRTPGTSSGTSSPRRYDSSRFRGTPFTYAASAAAADCGGGSCPGNAAATAAPACSGPILKATRRGCGGAGSTAPGSGHEQPVEQAGPGGEPNA